MTDTRDMTTGEAEAYRRGRVDEAREMLARLSAVTPRQSDGNLMPLYECVCGKYWRCNCETARARPAEAAPNCPTCKGTGWLIEPNVIGQRACPRCFAPEAAVVRAAPPPPAPPQTGPSARESGVSIELPDTAAILRRMHAGVVAAGLAPSTAPIGIDPRDPDGLAKYLTSWRRWLA